MKLGNPSPLQIIKLTMFCLSIFLIVGCGVLSDDKDDERDPGPNQEFELSADGGKVTVTIPEGSLPDSLNEKDVSIKKISADDNKIRVIANVSQDSIEAGIEYGDMGMPKFSLELLPSGLEFDNPLMLEIDRDLYESFGKGHFVLISKGNLEIIKLDSAEMADSSATTLKVPVSHFSKLIYLSDMYKMFSAKALFSNPLSLKVNQSVILPFEAKLDKNIFEVIILSNEQNPEAGVYEVNLFYLNYDFSEKFSDVSGWVNNPSFISPETAVIHKQKFDESFTKIITTEEITCDAEGTGEAHFSVRTLLSSIFYWNVKISVDEPLEPGIDYSSVEITALLKEAEQKWVDIGADVSRDGYFDYICKDEVTQCSSSEPECNVTEPFCDEAGEVCILPDLSCDATEESCLEIIDCSENDCNDTDYLCNATETGCISGDSLDIPIDPVCDVEPCTFTEVPLDITVESDEEHAVVIYVYDSEGNVISEETIDPDGGKDTVSVPEGGSVQVEYVMGSDGGSYAIDITEWPESEPVGIFLNDEGGYIQNDAQEVTVEVKYDVDANLFQDVTIKVYTKDSVLVHSILKDTVGEETVTVPAGGRIEVEFVQGDSGGENTETQEFTEFGDNGSVVADFTKEPPDDSGPKSVYVQIWTSDGPVYPDVNIVVLDSAGNIFATDVSDATGSAQVEVPKGGYIAVSGMQTSGSSTITRTVVVKDFGENNTLDLTFVKPPEKSRKRNLGDVTVNIAMPDSMPENMAKIVNSSSCNFGTSSSSTYYPMELEKCQDDAGFVIPWFLMYDSTGALIGYNMARCEISVGDTEIDCPLSEVKTDFQKLSMDYSEVDVEGLEWIDGRVELKLAGITKYIRLCVKSAAVTIPEVLSSEECQIPEFNTSTNSYEILIPPAGNDLLIDSLQVSQALIYPASGAENTLRQSNWSGAVLASEGGVVIPGDEMFTPPNNIAFDNNTQELSWSIPTTGLEPAHVVSTLRCTDDSFNTSEYYFISPMKDVSHTPVNIPENPLKLEGCNYSVSITSTAAKTIDDAFRSRSQVSGGNTNATARASVSGFPVLE